MKIGPKYKIARRLNAPIFEKTQTQKFAASKERKAPKFGRPKSSFGQQLIEKQKARFMYGINERQFKKYVSSVLAKKAGIRTDMLFQILENRLDNAVYRCGFAPTRRQARQMVSHGHIVVDGTKVTIPSFQVSKDCKIAVRKQSQDKGMFKNYEETSKTITVPEWISVDTKTKEATIIGLPKHTKDELLFDIGSIFEYYNR